MVSRLSKRFGLTKDRRPKHSPLTSEQKQAVDDLSDGIFDEGRYLSLDLSTFSFALLGDELSESFFLIPSDHEPSPATLKKENNALTAENDSLRRRLEAAEKVLQLRKEQDAQLRDSVYQATREIVGTSSSTHHLPPHSYQAQRTMGTSTINLPRQTIDASFTSPVPLPGYQTAREAQYARRVKELEDDLRALRSENEKHVRTTVHSCSLWSSHTSNRKR